MTGFYGKKAGAIIGTLVLATSILFAGCGGNEQAASQKVPVKAMKVLQQDAPVSYSYPGQLKGTDDVEVHSRVSGSVMEKYFKGGDTVQAGAPLYRIDSRQYESSVIEAEANLHKSEADLRNAKDELSRDEMLFSEKAISEQELFNQREDVAANQAIVESQRAAVQKAKENLDDTIVYAPMSGRLSVDDVAVGTYATAGSTKLVSIGSLDPIYAQFNVSETEYLNILAKAMEEGILGKEDESAETPPVKIVLSNGFEYPLVGKITAADRSFNDNSGSLTIKALFSNPYGALLPGMFARVKFLDVTVKDAVLVPQRAVQQLLDESFVLVVGDDGKSVSKNVVLGEKVGSYYIVKKGLTKDDTVIVEGLTNLQSGKDLDVTMVTADDMGFSMKESTEVVNKS
ncbi:RND efflux system, membrane fusion protein CmeA [Anaerovibrio sp. JC8]|uniref:efflux RND transporter periplasmic adaptor subunit n=1 Tax=Anaerovibrio sp. JC8 TaxID=1240085 RepID=UPI000A0AD14F|nr:efflux RND transporter periplasmic adaptor subunit [Anaerovibrio sp. JC8]ORT99176.1 RND efflux system, membrane fusion protein CmeA [Anaerovibrio sp. JC8]